MVMDWWSCRMKLTFPQMNEQKYTGLGGNHVHGEFLIHLIRSDLTHNLSTCHL